MEKLHSGSTESFWMESAQVDDFPQLKEDISNLHVCIVGGGVTGLTTAYLLLRAGMTVAVLDDGYVAAGETERTTAHITSVLDRRYFELIKMHGKEKSKLLAGSHNDAIDTIEYIVNEEQIDCDFSRVAGYLFLGENDEYKTLEKELKAVNEVGYQNVEMKTAIPLGIQIPALKFSAQAQFHIQKYVQGLCKAILKLGGYIFTGEHVRDMIGGKNIVLTTDSGKQIVAHNVVVATNTPVFDRIKLHTKQVAYRTYVIGFKVKKGLFEQALYWDTEEPYHYIRLQPIDGDDKNEMLIVGGEDHRTGEEADPESRFAALEDWTRKRIFTGNKVEFKWSGEIFEPNDGIAFIGKDPAHKGNVFIATGASGNGMTHAAIAARLLRDLISKKQNPLFEIYDPNRSPFGDIVTLVTENLNTAGQYAKALGPADVSSEEAIEAGEGAIMREGLKQKAVYKDESGVVHKLSAKCTHLGATLCWNSCEKSWDCPAHGSRFAGTGEVICGPANENIPPHLYCCSKTRSRDSLDVS